MLFREIKESDIDDVYSLALEAHAGITSLPKNRDLIAKKIDDKSYFFFGVEDQKLKKIVGVSAIKSNSQKSNPYHHYKVTEDKRPLSGKLQISKTRLLIPEKETTAFSELCTLFLRKDIRHAGLGRLLSLSRFLFIKLNRQLFDDQLKAYLRGVIVDDRAPFWEFVGRQFVDMPYAAFTELVREDKSLLLAVIPTTWPTVELLHPDAKKVIGVAHKNTEPARHLLENQGLIYDNEIDLLDGGPVLKGTIDLLKPFKTAKTLTVTAIRPVEGMTHIVTKTEGPFRSAMGAVVEEQNGLAIDEELAQSLSLELGSQILSLNIGTSA